ncbi:EamA-like transporter family protein [Paenibacillus sp. 1_12]|uniref:EamA family transporter n=1 Tax=Paenibacillus sp. 1_12 TaxID=1566278 RepID=UPI0008E3B896|nr:EamA family transporter [Paenibacillus sp. 1_12]SFL27739.1 EamA-like transporter family protein [Paenibacillus sp. 1_12]
MWFVFAAASAVCFGLRGILYQWTSQRPIDRNLLLLGVYLSGTIIAFVTNLVVGQQWSIEVWIGVLMGLFSFISNASMYRGFAVGKASLMAMFTGMPPVVVVIAAFLIWGERLTLGQSLSFVIIVFGLLLIRYSSDISIKNLKGAGWGVLTMFGFGLTDIISKQSTLIGAQIFPTLTAMYVTGTLLFGIAWLLNRRRQSLVQLESAAALEAAAASEVNASETASIAAPSSRQAAAANSAPNLWSVRKTLLWGLVIGLTNVSGMMLVLPAFKLGVTGLVSAVMAMNVVFVLLYARFGLKERFSPLEACGLTLALVGIIVLRLAG